MNAYKFEINNLAKLQSAFRSYPNIAGPEFAKGINIILANIQKLATDNDGGIFKFLTPRINRTGMLSLSFGYGIKIATPSNLTGSIGPTVEYAKYVNGGTKAHVIKVSDKKVLANRNTGQIFGKVVNHPGTKANPFMERIRYASAETANKEMASALERVIKKIA